MGREADFRAMAARRAQSQRDVRLEAVAAGSRGQALERLGKGLSVGDLVVYHPPMDLIYQVLEVTPRLDPQARPGDLRVVLGTAPFAVPASSVTPHGGLILVGHAELPPGAEESTREEPTREESVPVEEPVAPAPSVIIAD